MSDALQAAIVGVTRLADWQPGSHAAPLIRGRTPADLLRAVLIEQVLQETARIPTQQAAKDGAPPELLPAPDAASANLLLRVIESDAWALPEALDLVAQRGMRLPARALPLLLNSTGALRGQIAAVAGRRGAWLSKTLGTAPWLAGHAESSDLVELQRRFEEETGPARMASLRLWRQLDRSAARAAVAACWSAEKAEVKGELLDMLAVDLGEDDLPWLESLLNDRAASVRTRVRTLILRLPESKLRVQVLARLCALFQQDGGALQFTLPEAASPEDLALELSGKLGKAPYTKARFATELGMLAPPALIAEAVGVSAGELIAKLQQSPFWLDLLDAWLEQASGAGNPQLDAPSAAALSDWCCAVKPLAHDKPISERLPRLLAAMRPSDAARLAERIIDRRPQYAVSYETLLALPSPWPENLARRWLSWLAEEFVKGSKGYGHHHAWMTLLERARLALPMTVVPEALAMECPLPEHDYGQRQFQNLRRALDVRLALQQTLKPAVADGPQGLDP